MAVGVDAGTAETVDFVGAAELAAMKRSAVFISIGRGSCVDEEALAAALHAGTIAGGCARSRLTGLDC